jgi:hypothetical protein
MWRPGRNQWLFPGPALVVERDRADALEQANVAAAAAPSNAEGGDSFRGNSGIAPPPPISTTADSDDADSDSDDDSATVTIADDDSMTITIVDHTDEDYGGGSDARMLGGAGFADGRGASLPIAERVRRTATSPRRAPLPPNCAVIPLFHGDLEQEIASVPLAAPGSPAFEATVHRRGGIALQLARGVAFLRSVAIAHLDIKPTNVLLRYDRSGAVAQAVVADFDASVCLPRTWVEAFVQPARPWWRASGGGGSRGRSGSKGYGKLPRRADRFAPPELGDGADTGAPAGTGVSSNQCLDCREFGYEFLT